MKILIACEFSGVTSSAFRSMGNEVWSCDIVPTWGDPDYHLIGDVRHFLKDGWDMMIAFPPCRYLSYAGAPHWQTPGYRQEQGKAFRFFMQMVNAPIERICIENPRGLPCNKYRRPDQVVHPYMFGDPQRKRTCLWLKSLPPLWYGEPGTLFDDGIALSPPEPVSVSPSGQRRYYTDGVARNPQLRALTFPGMALAMAEQWG